MSVLMTNHSIPMTKECLNPKGLKVPQMPTASWLIGVRRQTNVGWEWLARRNNERVKEFAASLPDFLRRCGGRATFDTLQSCREDRRWLSGVFTTHFPAEHSQPTAAWRMIPAIHPRRSAPTRSWILALSGLSMLALTSLLLSAEKPKPKQGGMSGFGKMVPQGLVNRGVIIPSFDEAGKKSSELRAETLTRIDDDRLLAEKVTIEVYAETPDKTLHIDLKSAVHHLTDQLLRSGERSVVTRSDFETSGDSLVFDAATSIGCMKGRVRTLIFNPDTLSEKKEPAKTPPPVQPPQK
jgi:hypothetical protein